MKILDSVIEQMTGGVATSVEWPCQGPTEQRTSSPVLKLSTDEEEMGDGAGGGILLDGGDLKGRWTESEGALVTGLTASLRIKGTLVEDDADGSGIDSEDTSRGAVRKAHVF